jgi:hypothetical protein
MLTASMEPSSASAISAGWLRQARRCTSAIPLASLGQASRTDSLAACRPELPEPSATVCDRNQDLV